MGFEPTRAKHTGLAVQPLNLSGTASTQLMVEPLARNHLKLIRGV
jgi:hypothetical protein